MRDFCRQEISAWHQVYLCIFEKRLSCKDKETSYIQGGTTGITAITGRTGVNARLIIAEVEIKYKMIKQLLNSKI
jgi:hypothetical protein